MKQTSAVFFMTFGTFFFGSPEVYAQHSYTETGVASYYHDRFEGRKTANGEIFSQDSMTAAHKHLPLGSYVKVTNLHNQRSIVLRINDRMPAWNKRSIDLSFKAASELDYIYKGLTKVLIEVIDPPSEVPPREVPPITYLETDYRLTAFEMPERTVYLKYPMVMYYTEAYNPRSALR
jgi:rare lipoprotein A